jgi:phage terminase small subunit
MKKLTQRQQRFLKELPRSKSVAEAARRAGYSPKFAGQAGYLALQRIAEKAPELLDNHEQTLREVIEKNIKPALEATKTIYIRYRGAITDQVEVPDNETRLKTVIQVLKVMGAYPRK